MFKSIRFVLPFPPSLNKKYGYTTAPPGKKIIKTFRGMKQTKTRKRPRVVNNHNLSVYDYKKEQQNYHKGYARPYNKPHVKKYYEDCKFAIILQLKNYPTYDNYFKCNLIIREPIGVVIDEDNLYKCLYDAIEISGLIENDKLLRGGERYYDKPTEKGEIAVELVPIESKYTYDKAAHARVSIPNTFELKDDFGEVNGNV